MGEGGRISSPRQERAPPCIGCIVLILTIWGCGVVVFPGARHASICTNKQQVRDIKEIEENSVPTVQYTFAPYRSSTSTLKQITAAPSISHRSQHKPSLDDVHRRGDRGCEGPRHRTTPCRLVRLQRTPSPACPHHLPVKRERKRHAASRIPTNRRTSCVKHTGQASAATPALSPAHRVNTSRSSATNQWLMPSICVCDVMAYRKRK